MHVTKLLSPRFLRQNTLGIIPTYKWKEQRRTEKMNNFPNPYGQQTAAYNNYQIQQMFPQP
jgi:hypothetical protein